MLIALCVDGILMHVSVCFQMEKPSLIVGLIVVDPAARSAGFREWGEEKVLHSIPISFLFLYFIAFCIFLFSLLIFCC